MIYCYKQRLNVCKAFVTSNLHAHEPGEKPVGKTPQNVSFRVCFQQRSSVDSLGNLEAMISLTHCVRITTVYPQGFFSILTLDRLLTQRFDLWVADEAFVYCFTCFN